MAESGDLPAFALPSGSQDLLDEEETATDNMDPSLRPQAQPQEELPSIQTTIAPAISDTPTVTMDLLGFGDVTTADAAATTTAPPSDDFLDFFSAPLVASPQPTFGASSLSTAAVDPFMDFSSPPDSLLEAANKTDTFDGTATSDGGEGDVSENPNGVPSSVNQLDIFSSVPSVSTPAPLQTHTQPSLDLTSPETDELANELALVKQQLETTQQQAASQSEQIALLQAQLGGPVSPEAVESSENGQELREQIEQLQSLCDEKDKVIEQLQQQQLDGAANTIPSDATESPSPNSEEIQQLQQELDQAHGLLQQQTEESSRAIETLNNEKQQQIDELRQQVEDAKKHAEGFKTDQARYRELQSLWSNEQTRRTEAEARAESAETTVDELRKLMDQQGNEIQQMQDKIASVKKDAEEKARLAKEQVQNLEDLTKQRNSELATLQEAAAATAANGGVPEAVDENRQLKLELETKSVELERLQKEVEHLRGQRTEQEKEFELLKADHDEQHRKEMALTNRLNAAKKTEAEKANLAERLEDELKATKEELEVHKLELKNTQMDKEQTENALEKLKRSSQAKFSDVEAALKDERALNEERKKKMKAFVETKADELRQLQADNDALQSEVATTSKSLMDLNNRWKQLHAQWVQSQTRNRELQRDLNRMKTDSENLHKAGDSIQMKLSRSTNETEEHKHKRLAAKHELMTVLRTLEAERELTNRLRDNIKYTFTPKALSQQQLVHEALEEFETQLLKLAQRLSVPLPPISTPVSATGDAHDAAPVTNGEGATLDDDVAKLDHETQRVSQSIMSLSDNIERLRVILEMGGTRSCASVLTELLTTGGMQSSPAAIAGDRGSMNGARMNAVRSHRYGYVPNGSN